MVQKSHFDIGIKVRKEVLLPVAVYAGVLATYTAFSAAKNEFDQPVRASAKGGSVQTSQEDA